MRISMTIKNKFGEWTTSTQEATAEQIAEAQEGIKALMPEPGFFMFTDHAGQQVLLPGKVAGESIFIFNIQE